MNTIPLNWSGSWWKLLKFNLHLHHYMNDEHIYIYIYIEQWWSNRTACALLLCWWWTGIPLPLVRQMDLGVYTHVSWNGHSKANKRSTTHPSYCRWTTSTVGHQYRVTSSRTDQWLWDRNEISSICVIAIGETCIFLSSWLLNALRALSGRCLKGFESKYFLLLSQLSTSIIYYFKLIIEEYKTYL